MSLDKNKVIKLCDLSNYQKDSIVSQIIINNTGGTVTYFSFDEGQGLSEHSAPYDALVYILEGKVEINIDKTKHILKKHEMIIMPANIPHSLYAINKFKMILILCKNEK